ncbi:MAG: Unknown protein [uncultured Sulfurovum sp.]|uniref:Uncharacterized protein n=1 Tax=uncultured Sulfurovum sp. TaxID=269237 RepID=A0A6S6RVG3_9BACT|nr:MAG: Unknown protein [uncultured Sulfurovum sp.]
MKQEHLELVQLDMTVFEIFPLTKGNKTKLCKLVDKEIGVDYEINEDDREYDIVIFDVEEQSEIELIEKFVTDINEKLH